jgi:hypothetical protein
VADDRIVTFNEDARRDIRETVRAYKSGDNSGNGLGGLVGAIGRFVFQVKLGKADGAITKGTSGTVSEYRGTTAGSETDTTTNHTCYARFGDVGSGKWVLYFRFLSHWEILIAEC